MGFFKGMGLGVAAGLTASIIAAVVYKNNKKSFKKKAAKAFKAMGDLIDNVQCIMK